MTAPVKEKRRYARAEKIKAVRAERRRRAAGEGEPSESDERAAAEFLGQVLRPQPGPQEEFCASPADVVFYGGAAGGGKSYALCLEAGRNVHVPGYAAVIFRRTTPELTGGGSIWEESQGIFPVLGGVPRESPTLNWLFKTNVERREALIEFKALQYEKDIHAHQGKQYAFIGFDELTSFTYRQFWYLVSRNRSTCGVKPYIRATCNPDPDSWVRKMIDWWIGKDGFPIVERSGVVRYFYRDGHDLHWADTAEELRRKFPEKKDPPTSFTFIAAKLEDNPALMEKDPGYRGKLESLSYVDRMQLLYGNWDVRAAAGNFFKRGWFRVVDARPTDVVCRVRAWDKAATRVTPGSPDPDWTVGVLMSKTKDGTLYVEHVERIREAPLQVERTIVNVSKSDGPKVVVAMWQDPAQAGKSEIAHFTRLLLGRTVFSQHANQDKLTWAKPLSSQAEAGNVVIVAGPWNDAYLSTLEAFPPEKVGHDDDVDASSLALVYIAKHYLERLRALTRWRDKPRPVRTSSAEAAAEAEEREEDEVRLARLKRRFPNGVPQGKV